MSCKIKSSKNSVYSRYMEYLFELTSNDVYPSSVNVPNKSWDDYIDLVWRLHNEPVPLKVYTNNLTVVSIDNPSNLVCVGFSSGRDSVTLSLMLKDYNIPHVLYHVKGLNRSYQHESKVAEEYASHNNIPIVFNHVVISGKPSSVDPVVKNQLILSYMIDYMIDNNIVRSSLGDYPDDTIDVTSLSYNTSDLVELFIAFEKAIRSTFSQFRFTEYFKNATQASAYLMVKHSNQLNYLQSCVLPDRFRGRNSKLNVEKYGLNVFNNRCYTCWKCCREYLFMVVFGVVSPNKDYLKNKVIPVLKKCIYFYHNIDGNSISSLKDLFSIYMNLEQVNRYKNDVSLIDSDLRFLDSINDWFE